MKSFKFKLTISILIFFSFITISNYFDNIYKNNPIYAANEKVTTIERSYDYKDNKIKEIYSGKTASGKVIWTYKKLPYRAGGQYCYSDYCVKNNKVYIWAVSTLHVLNRNSGKCILKKKVGSYGNGAVAVDSKGNIYGASVDKFCLTKLNKKGKILWKTDEIDGHSSAGGTYDIKIHKNTITVYCEYSDYEYYAFSAKTGKFIKYGPSL